MQQSSLKNLFLIIFSLSNTFKRGFAYSFTLALVIIVLIILYIYVKRKMDREYIENIDHERIEKEKKIEENKKVIVALFESKLKKKIFDKTKLVNDCECCSICIENFEVGVSEVSVTPCNHIFHFECLKKWIDDNVLNPKCPNCNYNLLQEEKNEMKCSQGVYDIPEIPINVVRSHDHRPTNIGGRVSYNEHNNSINLEANGIDTGENRFINRNEMHRNRR